MNIKQLLEMPVGTKVSEYTLLIRTARGASTDSDGKSWQDVRFIDASGEMEGQIQIKSEAHKWQSKTNIGHYSSPIAIPYSPLIGWFIVIVAPSNFPSFFFIFIRIFKIMLS